MASEQVEKPVHIKRLVPCLTRAQGAPEVSWITCGKGFTAAAACPSLASLASVPTGAGAVLKTGRGRTEAPGVATGPLSGSATAGTRTYCRSLMKSGKLVKGNHLPGPHL